MKSCSGAASQARPPQGIRSTVSPRHDPLHTEPSALVQATTPVRGTTQLAGSRETRMTAKAAAAASAIQSERGTSARVQDDGRVHQARGAGAVDAGRVHADAVLLRE